MKTEQVLIEAKDGKCNAWFFTPDGAGSWPGVIMYMDAFGIRPAMKQMAEYIAKQGYAVLLPDLFYRFGPYETLDPKEVFKGDFRAIVGPRMASTDNQKASADTEAYLKFLDGRKEVAGKKVGTVGFCMGGGMAITAEASYPDRIVAAASFHGGNLATDAPTSPHLVVSKIKGEVYIGAADKDHSYPPEMAKRFEDALKQAGVRYKAELYEGQMHGWMKPDMPVFDVAAADRGWKELFALYSRTLH